MTKPRDPERTAWFDAAVQYAVDCHRGQMRKGSDAPYIVHPLRVGLTLQLHGFAEPVVIAGLLHDVVEDCGIALAELAARFDERVAALVEAVTEPDKSKPWDVRKRESLDRMDHSDADALAIKAADALDNVRSILADHAVLGPAVWERFTRGAEQQAWYYGEVAARVVRGLGGRPLARELAGAAAELACVVAADR
ncbi:MAG: bifunctional (p)ppGpp synthetase/guanosine-3',5'-bis(diphosphate) 3'-pyrophosphohydrolase [Deltaproteobacteria bacterium]|nr:MAG: bifunctional (p)ppGpp synthetase/guanosine-3',5'-bis(diphosphate) 3'-pyrophosphohydrolase [Deltaproteobacteria bacterium]